VGRLAFSPVIVMAWFTFATGPFVYIVYLTETQPRVDVVLLF